MIRAGGEDLLLENALPLPLCAPIAHRLTDYSLRFTSYGLLPIPRRGGRNKGLVHQRRILVRVRHQIAVLLPP